MHNMMIWWVLSSAPCVCACGTVCVKLAVCCLCPCTVSRSKLRSFLQQDEFSLDWGDSWKCGGVGGGGGCTGEDFRVHHTTFGFIEIRRAHSIDQPSVSGRLGSRADSSRYRGRVYRRRSLLEMVDVLCLCSKLTHTEIVIFVSIIETINMIPLYHKDRKILRGERGGEELRR